MTRELRRLHIAGKSVHYDPTSGNMLPFSDPGKKCEARQGPIRIRPGTRTPAHASVGALHRQYCSAHDEGPDATPKRRPMRVVNAVAWGLFLVGASIMFLTDHSYLLGWALAIVGIALPLSFLFWPNRRGGDTKD